MKRIVLGSTLALALACSAWADEPNPNIEVQVNANNQFAFDLYARLAEKPGNKFFSPYSISNALGMTYAGAKGQTAAEMAKTLHFTLKGEELHAALGEVMAKLQGKPGTARPFQLTTANALWAQKGLVIRPEFLRITQTNYQAGLQLVDFIQNPDDARKTINHWVEDKTKDKIKDLLQPGTIRRDTRLVLTNAIYFKADWLSPFEKEQTRPGDFTNGAGAFKVPMMHHVFFATYLGANDYQLLQMGYKGGEVSMAVILPKKMDGLAAVEKSLSAKSLREALAGAKGARVNVTLPKFKMTQQFKLKETLSALGMPTAFGAGADFSGIAESSEGLCIDDVIHKAFVAVDEKGTEAAAATAVVIKTLSEPAGTPIEFKADHPFLFVIRHNATGSILFMGRVNDPR